MIVIKAENISKQYRLGQVGSKTIASDFKRWSYRLRGKEDPYAKIGEINDRSQKGNSDYVWALRDINFEVKQGEVLGIIGKNGAGKSTLLKLLSRVTTPTTGKIGIQGRMATLLEVGTGFHPELTGRENVFLNGAIMGMSKTEIKSKFDEIVDFSGVERYIDTPVKRYSSGMHVRLGFAVAAHLEPEILVVDEVLAVGDVEFQRKCMGKMKLVSGEGRTVLFVSHNMSSIKALCERGILLEYGKIIKDSNINDVVKEYINSNINSGESFIRYSAQVKNEVGVVFASLFNGKVKANTFNSDDILVLKLKVYGTIKTDFSFEIIIKDQNQTPIVFMPIGLLLNQKHYINKNETKEFDVQINLPHMATGRYYLDVILAEQGKRFIDYNENILQLDIISKFLKNTSWEFKSSRNQGSVLNYNVNVIEL